MHSELLGGNWPSFTSKPLSPCLHPGQSSRIRILSIYRNGNRAKNRSRSFSQPLLNKTLLVTGNPAHIHQARKDSELESKLQFPVLKQPRYILSHNPFTAAESFGKETWGTGREGAAVCLKSGVYSNLTMLDNENEKNIFSFIPTTNYSKLGKKLKIKQSDVWTLMAYF